MNIQVSLPDELNELIEAKVASGRYASASDVVSDALRLLEQDDAAKLKWLREAYRIGIESGDAGPFDLEEFKAEARARRDAARR